jgi:hypothetical protein
LSDRVDQLFGSEAGGTPGPGPMPRNNLVLGLLLLAVPLDLFGLVCCTSIPGMVLTLSAWLIADTDLAKVESGHLPMEKAPTLVRYKQVAFGLLIFCGLTFIVQMTMLSNGVYESWLVWLIRFFGE